MSNLTYLIYFVPAVFIVLSYKYKLKFNKLRGSGKVPDIVGARQRQNFFLALAVISALIILIITNEQFFWTDTYRQP